MEAGKGRSRKGLKQERREAVKDRSRKRGKYGKGGSRKREMKDNGQVRCRTGGISYCFYNYTLYTYISTLTLFILILFK